MAAEAASEPQALPPSRDEPREGGEQPAAGATDGSLPLADSLRKLQKRFQQEEEYISLLKAENDTLQSELQHLISQVAKQQSRKSRRSVRSASRGMPRNSSVETYQSGVSQKARSTVEGILGVQDLPDAAEETNSRADPKPGPDMSSTVATNGDAEDEAKMGPLSSVANQAGSEDGSVLMVDPLQYQTVGANTEGLGPMRKRIVNLISWDWFEVIIGVVILFNAIVIGWESEWAARRRASGQDEVQEFTVFDVFEVFFMIIYIVELCLRFGAYSYPYFIVNRWAQFDLALVLVGIVQFIVVYGTDDRIFILDKVMLGRILRLARLTRLVRLSSHFRELWLLIEGLMHSFTMLLWTFITMGIVTYIYAIIGLETIGYDYTTGNPDFDTAARNQFGSLGRAMMTLIQAITLDSIGAIYTPIILYDAGYVVYFVTFMLIGSVALMNLVTAIMVDTSMQHASSDRETRKAIQDQERKKLVIQLGELFKEMDADGSGKLDIHELKHAPPNVMEQLTDIVKMEDAIVLFHTLDTDGSGSLGITEFCEGVLKASQGKPMELLSVMKQCHDILGSLKELSTQMKAFKGLTASPAAAALTAKVAYGRSISPGRSGPNVGFARPAPSSGDPDGVVGI